MSLSEEATAAHEMMVAGKMQAIRKMVKARRDRRADLGDERKYDGERSHDNHPNLALTKE